MQYKLCVKAFVYTTTPVIVMLLLANNISIYSTYTAFLS